MKRQSNTSFSHTVAVDNALENVWEYLIDVSRWSEWDTELKSATLQGDFKVGAKGKLIPRKGPELSFYISEVVPLQTYTFQTKMLVGHLEIKRTLTRKEGKIYFTDTIQFTGILRRLFGLMLGRGFKKVLPEVMQHFKELAEKE